MPPRRKPTNITRVEDSRSQPDSHLEGFTHYLQAECGLAKNSVLAYTRDLRRFAGWYAEHGPETLSAVTLGLLTDYLQYLHSLHLAASSVARNLVSLKMFFRYLMLEGLIKESVADLLNSPRLGEHLPKVLSAEKVDALLAAPSRQDPQPLRDRALLALLYATGCRASEVCGLRLRDVSLEESYCRCLGKGNKERMVSLNAVAIEAIRVYLDKERPARAGTSPDSPLLTTRRGRPIDRITVWKLVKRYAARIGASKEVTPHTLRHTFATHMLAGGAEIRALQELLGHASIRTTQIYTHVEHSRLKNIHERFHPRG